MRTTAYQIRLLMIAVVGLFTMACSNTAAEQKEETTEALDRIEEKITDANTSPAELAWEAERSAIVEDLQRLLKDITNKLDETTANLENRRLTVNERAEREGLKAELIKEKKLVEDMISDAGNSTYPTWSSTRTGLQKGLDDTKAWWSRLKDNVDKKTDADNDKDGH